MVSTVVIPGRWVFNRGDFTTRADLHSSYGGASQGGIVPSPRQGYVFLFHTGTSMPNDGWSKDGHFYYTGALSDRANGAVEHAWSQGRRLQVMERLTRTTTSAANLHRYVDSFVLDGIEETVVSDGSGKERRLPRFRLRTIDAVTHSPGQVHCPGDPRVVDVRRVERCDLLCRDHGIVVPGHERPETRLSKEFERYLLTQGYPVHRLGIRHTPNCTPMLTDTWLGHLNLLIEAKAGPNMRNDARMAVGQLADYTRFVPGALRAVLLPAHPGGDLLSYVRSQNADVIWWDGSDWCTTGGWAATIGIKQVSQR